MIKRIGGWEIRIGLLCVGLTLIFYMIHYAIFHNLDDITHTFFGNLGFVFIQAIIVMLVMEKVINEKERRERLEKTNMVIGVFFNEAGEDLLALFSSSDSGIEGIRDELKVSVRWTDKELDALAAKLRGHSFGVDISKVDLDGLHEFMNGKREFLLRLLENPILLEHESFTDLLYAVFHLADELHHRKKAGMLSGDDLEHIAGDIKRAYSNLAGGWAGYMLYLKKNYPYLFALAMRKNPFLAGNY